MFNIIISRWVAIKRCSSMCSFKVAISYNMGISALPDMFEGSDVTLPSNLEMCQVHDRISSLYLYTQGCTL